MTETNYNDVEKQLASLLGEFELNEFLEKKDEYFVKDVKNFLEEILTSRQTYFHPDGKYLFKRKGSPDDWNIQTKQSAAKYLTKTWMHNPWLTRFMIKELAHCQLEALSFMAMKGIYPEYSFRHSLEEPYSNFVPPLLGLAFFAGLVGLLYYLLDHDRIAWAALLGIYIVYHYALKTVQVIVRTKQRRKWREWLGLFAIVRHEISLDVYDIDTVIRRLVSFEAKGLYPYSLIFPLLELRKGELANTRLDS